MKVALYARVSTSNQEKRGTIESQISSLRKYAADNDYTVVEDYVCKDDGYSGALLVRPQLDRLRDGAQTGNFDAVLVLSPDRLSRKYAYLILILEEFERFGTRVIFLDNTIPEDPHGALLIQIQGAVAEYERVKISERYRRGRLHLARQGEIVCTSIPYGYRRIPRKDGIKAHLVINEFEADIVRKIFFWHAYENMSVRRIAKRLTHEGHPTSKGGTWWGETTVHKILHRECYLGTLYYNKSYETSVPVTDNNKRGIKKVLRPESEWIQQSIPSIIDQKTFDRSQECHLPNSQFSPRNIREEHWLLRRMVRCEKCGLKCSCVEHNRSGMPPVYYYRCNTLYRTEKQPHCRPKHIRAKELDDFVWKQIKNHLLNPELLLKAHGTFSVNHDYDQSFLQAQINNTQRRLGRFEDQRNRLVDMYQDGIIEKMELTSRNSVLSKRIDSEKADLINLQNEHVNISGKNHMLSKIQSFTSTVSNNIDKLSFHQKQKLIRTIIKEVVIRDRVVKIYFKIPLSEEPKNDISQDNNGKSGNVSSQLNLRSRSSPRRRFYRVGLFREHSLYLYTPGSRNMAGKGVCLSCRRGTDRHGSGGDDQELETHWV